MRLIYISLIIVFSFANCKKDTKLPKFSITELQERELDSVKKLLTLSRSFYKIGDYEKTILNLENLISRYATFEEILEAQELLLISKLRLIIIRINEAKTIDSVLILIKNNTDPEIAIAASNRVEELINKAKSIQELEDYLNQNKINEHSDLANNKINELKENKEQEAYASALKNKTSDEWKKFLDTYPNHKNKNDIEKEIIKLEVTEIFNGDYGEIPTSQLLGSKNNSQSVIDIENKTRYTLTLRYFGPTVEKISIPPYGKQTLKLKSGVYKIAASVNASNVRNFAGTENLFGEYSSGYYISSSNY
jgi:hypothetical protein